MTSNLCQSHNEDSFWNLIQTDEDAVEKEIQVESIKRILRTCALTADELDLSQLNKFSKKSKSQLLDTSSSCFSTSDSNKKYSSRSKSAPTTPRSKVKRSCLKDSRTRKVHFKEMEDMDNIRKDYSNNNHLDDGISLSNSNIYNEDVQSSDINKENILSNEISNDLKDSHEINAVPSNNTNAVTSENKEKATLKFRWAPTKPLPAHVLVVHLRVPFSQKLMTLKKKKEECVFESEEQPDVPVGSYTSTMLMGDQAFNMEPLDIKFYTFEADVYLNEEEENQLYRDSHLLGPKGKKSPRDANVKKKPSALDIRLSAYDSHKSTKFNTNASSKTAENKSKLLNGQLNDKLPPGSRSNLLTSNNSETSLKDNQKNGDIIPNGFYKDKNVNGSIVDPFPAAFKVPKFNKFSSPSNNPSAIKGKAGTKMEGDSDRNNRSEVKGDRSSIRRSKVLEKLVQQQLKHKENPLEAADDVKYDDRSSREDRKEKHEYSNSRREHSYDFDSDERNRSRSNEKRRLDLNDESTHKSGRESYYEDEGHLGRNKETSGYIGRSSANKENIDDTEHLKASKDEFEASSSRLVRNGASSYSQSNQELNRYSDSYSNVKSSEPLDTISLGIGKDRMTRDLYGSVDQLAKVNYNSNKNEYDRGNRSKDRNYYDNDESSDRRSNQGRYTSSRRDDSERNSNDRITSSERYSEGEYSSSKEYSQRSGDRHNTSTRNNKESGYSSDNVHSESDRHPNHGDHYRKDSAERYYSDSEVKSSSAARKPHQNNSSSYGYDYKGGGGSGSGSRVSFEHDRDRQPQIRTPLVTTRSSHLVTGSSSGRGSSSREPVDDRSSKERMQDLEDTVLSLKRVLTDREKELEIVKCEKHKLEGEVRESREPSRSSGIALSHGPILESQKETEKRINELIREKENMATEIWQLKRDLDKSAKGQALSRRDDEDDDDSGNAGFLHRKIEELESKVKDLQEVNETTANSLIRTEKELEQLKQENDALRKSRNRRMMDIEDENKELKKKVAGNIGTSSSSGIGTDVDYLRRETEHLREDLSVLRDKNHQLIQDNIKLTEHLKDLEIRSDRGGTMGNTSSSLSRGNGLDDDPDELVGTCKRYKKEREAALEEVDYLRSQLQKSRRDGSLNRSKERDFYLESNSHRDASRDSTSYQLSQYQSSSTMVNGHGAESSNRRTRKNSGSDISDSTAVLTSAHPGFHHSPPEANHHPHHSQSHDHRTTQLDHIIDSSSSHHISSTSLPKFTNELQHQQPHRSIHSFDDAKRPVALPTIEDVLDDFPTESSNFNTASKGINNAPKMNVVEDIVLGSENSINSNLKLDDRLSKTGYNERPVNLVEDELGSNENLFSVDNGGGSNASTVILNESGAINSRSNIQNSSNTEQEKGHGCLDIENHYVLDSVSHDKKSMSSDWIQKNKSYVSQSTAQIENSDSKRTLMYSRSNIDLMTTEVDYRKTNHDLSPYHTVGNFGNCKNAGPIIDHSPCKIESIPKTNIPLVFDTFSDSSHSDTRDSRKKDIVNSNYSPSSNTEEFDVVVDCVNSDNDDAINTGSLALIHSSKFALPNDKSNYTDYSKINDFNSDKASLSVSCIKTGVVNNVDPLIMHKNFPRPPPSLVNSEQPESTSWLLDELSEMDSISCVGINPKYKETSTVVLPTSTSATNHSQVNLNNTLNSQLNNKEFLSSTQISYAPTYLKRSNSFNSDCTDFLMGDVDQFVQNITLQQQNTNLTDGLPTSVGHIPVAASTSSTHVLSATKQEEDKLSSSFVTKQPHKQLQQYSISNGVQSKDIGQQLSSSTFRTLSNLDKGSGRLTPEPPLLNSSLRSVSPKPVATQHNKHMLGSGSSSDCDTSLMANRRPFCPRNPADINLEDLVKFSRQGGKISRGLVKYVGHLPGKNDTYLGVELEHEMGKHDGLYDGQRYFHCKNNKGVFVAFSKVVMAWGS